MKFFLVINGTEATVIKAKNLQSATGEISKIVNFKREFIIREISNIESLQMHIAINL